MAESLSETLRRGADSVAVPSLDLGELVAEAGRRRRRRRYAILATTAAAVSAIVVGAVLVTGAGSGTEEPSPAGPASPSTSTAVDTHGARALVYADGRTVHVGDKSIQADKPVAFIAPTDDGAVYEATLDGTLWFTDGTTTEVIGTSDWTAAPTAHRGNVDTGEYGSLVVWADWSDGRRQIATEFVVYDTSLRQEVARIPFPEQGRGAGVEYVGENEVWFAPEGGSDRHVYRLNVRSGVTTLLLRSDLDAVLDTRPRIFKAVARDGRVVHGEPFFTVRRNRLIAGIHDNVVEDDAGPTTLADGTELRLRLPAGYAAPWPADEVPALAVSQWLDDDHIVLWADDGGGDLPAKQGDFLVCQLPNGVCRVTVPRSSQPYVAPYLS